MVGESVWSLPKMPQHFPQFSDHIKVLTTKYNKKVKKLIRVVENIIIVMIGWRIPKMGKRMVSLDNLHKASLCFHALYHTNTTEMNILLHFIHFTFAYKTHEL